MKTDIAMPESEMVSRGSRGVVWWD